MAEETVIALLISAVSLVFGIYTGVFSIKRSTRKDERRDASELATVMVKLEDIVEGIGEIKSDIANVKLDIKALTERLIVAEQRIRQADKTIDEIQKRRN